MRPSALACREHRPSSSASTTLVDAKWGAIICYMEKVFRWTTPESAIEEEVHYWRERSIEDRVSAVETIREATLEIYTDEAADRLERVHRFVDISRSRTHGAASQQASVRAPRGPRRHRTAR